MSQSRKIVDYEEIDKSGDFGDLSDSVDGELVCTRVRVSATNCVSFPAA